MARRTACCCGISFSRLTLLPTGFVAVILALLLAPVTPALAATITVNTESDDPTMVLASLRSAIQSINQGSDANGNITVQRSGAAYGVADEIDFAIPGTGVHTITPASVLPQPTKPVKINGYSQPGASPNTKEVGNDAVLLIEISGASSAGNFDGLVIQGDSAIVTGLIIDGFAPHYGIFVDTAGTNAQILGNFIGLNNTATAASANNIGILIDGAPGATIGTPDKADRNVLSGNTAYGVYLQGSTATGAKIQGNYVGTNAAGDAAIPNETGIVVNDAPNITIGGTTTSAPNLVSGNSQYGILVQHGAATGVSILGNAVGTDASRTAGIPNGWDIGIDTAPGVTIGGTGAGAANLIAFNSQGGVSVVNAAATGNAIRGNSIVSGGGLGIDLNADGVTANDTGDGDSGPNTLQNFPVLASASLVGGATRVAGSINSAANTTYTLDFYASDACNASGKTYLGSTSAPTGGGGNASFNLTALPAVAAGQVIAATATDPANNTSEFSACRSLVAPDVTVAPATVSVTEGGATGTFDVSLTTVPASTVTITLTFDTGQIGVSPATLTFQADSTALTPQTVTVAAVNDAVVEGALSRQITFGAASSDGAYASIVPSPMTVNVADNDSAGVAVVQSGGSTAVTEGGATDTFTVVLNSQPTADVTIAMDPGIQVTISPSSVQTFTSANWNVPQTVTVAAVDDTIAEGPHTGTIAFTVTSGDSSYNGQPVPSVAVAIADNDTSGIVVNPTSGLVTTEAGGSATFTVRLSSVPTGAVTIPLSSSDTTEGTVSPGSLTFQPNASALTAQTVTVTGADDQVTDGDVAYTIVLGAAASTDPAYNGQNPSDVDATNRDDDSSGSLGFTATAVQVPESTGQVTLTVQRGGAGPASATVRPSGLAPVSVTYATADGTAVAGQDYIAVAGVLSFDVNETSKTVVVPILHDETLEAAETFTVTLDTPTGGASLGTSSTTTVTILDSTLPVTVPAEPPSSPTLHEDDTDKRHKETEEQQQQRERTNRSGKDDVHIEGNVVEVHQDERPPYVVIANRDGLVKVVLLCGDQCPTIRVGDCLEADGEKQHELLFDASDVSVTRAR